MDFLLYLCLTKPKIGIMDMQNCNWELIGIAVGIVATILGGVWFIFSKIFGMGRFSRRIEELENRTCNAACDLHDRDIEVIKGELKSVNENLIKVTSLLLLKHKEAGNLFSVKNSPRQLNDMGKQVLADIKGMDFLQTNQDFLFVGIDGYQPKTALDVENAAHAVCAVSTNNEMFNAIKNFVYNSPSYKLKDAEGRERLYDLAMSDVCFILSLPLRDMYLKAHPEIVVE